VRKLLRTRREYGRDYEMNHDDETRSPSSAVGLCAPRTLPEAAPLARQQARAAACCPAPPSALLPNVSPHYASRLISLITRASPNI